MRLDRLIDSQKRKADKLKSSLIHINKIRQTKMYVSGLRGVKKDIYQWMHNYKSGAIDVQFCVDSIYKLVEKNHGKRKNSRGKTVKLSGSVKITSKRNSSGSGETVPSDV